MSTTLRSSRNKSFGDAKKQAEQTHGIGDPGKSPVLHEFLLLAGKNIKVQSRGCKGKECNEYKPAEIHNKILPVVYYSLKLW